MAPVAGSWSPGIGHRDALVWVIVGLYAIAFGLAVVALVTARRAGRRLAEVDPDEAGRQRLLARVWTVIAVVLLVFGLGRQFELQTWFIDTMRRTAWRDGWYQRRREYQAEVISGLIVLGVFAAAVVAYVLRRVVGRIALVLAGVVALGVFVAVRAISFHYVDKLLELGGDDLGSMLETAGLLLIIAATLKWWFDERRLVAARLEGQPSASLALSMP